MDRFASQGLVPLRINTCSSITAIVLVASDGQGLSILPACVVRRQLTQGSLIALDVSPPLPEQEIFAAYPKTVVNRGLTQIVRLIHLAIDKTGFVE
jgi:DNA-binding transcriptional LysR family regulator